MKKRNKYHYSSDKFFKDLLKDPEMKRKYEEEKLKTEIAMKVKDIRKKKRLTQTALAEKIGSKQSTIARLESGKDTRTPSLPLLSRIATSCNCELDFRFKSKKKIKARS